MSFTFEWPRFSKEFHTDAKQLLEAALNKGNKPPVIADRIYVVELEMGTQPPDLEIRDIGELTTEQFRGIFRLTYAGDAYIVLRTKVQANPLHNKRHDIHHMTGSVGILAAHQPLVVPMLLRLSHFVLSAYVVLVVSKQKGITLVFKTDPLQNVDVNSTFDSIAVIQKYIQKEIEGQLRNMFREDLPTIIHRLSQRWLAAQTERKVVVQIAYNSAPHIPTPMTKESLDALSQAGAYYIPSMAAQSDSLRDIILRQASNSHLGYVKSQRIRTNVDSSNPLEHSVFPDIENYDPTYGLRPEGIPMKSTYGKYADMFKRTKGLGDLPDAPDELSDDNSIVSFDLVNWDPVVSERASSSTAEEYETIPAVGGGAITRPRIYHSQSLLQPSLDVENSAESSDWTEKATTSTQPGATRANGPMRPTISARQRSLPLRRPELSVHGQPWLPMHHRRRLDDSPTPSTLNIRTIPSSMDASGSSLLTPPTPPPTALFEAESPPSLSEVHSASPSRDSPSSDEDGNIVLRPAMNRNVSHLSVLSHSYHTLSPYTQSLEHFMVRSGPPRETAPPADRRPTKARRKRTYRLLATSGSSLIGNEMPPRHINTPSPPSDCELSDVDHYFRSPPHTIRRRMPYQQIG